MHSARTATPSYVSAHQNQEEFPAEKGGAQFDERFDELFKRIEQAKRFAKTGFLQEAYRVIRALQKEHPHSEALENILDKILSKAEKRLRTIDEGDEKGSEKEPAMKKRRLEAPAFQDTQQFSPTQHSPEPPPMPFLPTPDPRNHPAHFAPFQASPSQLPEAQDSFKITQVQACEFATDPLSKFHTLLGPLRNGKSHEKDFKKLTTLFRKHPELKLAKDPHGNSVVHAFFAYRPASFCQELLESKVFHSLVNSQNLRGATPLHLAVNSNPKQDIAKKIRLLFKYEGNANIVDFAGCLPEFYCDAKSKDLINHLMEMAAPVELAQGSAGSDEDFATETELLEDKTAILHPNFRLIESESDQEIKEIIADIFRTQIEDKDRILMFSSLNIKNWNEIVQNGIDQRLKIRYIDKVIGFGVFATKNIPKDTHIGFYTGVYKLIPESEAQNYDNTYTYDILEDVILNIKDKATVNRLYNDRYRSKSNEKYVLKIDAKLKGNFGRFINHDTNPEIFNLDTQYVMKENGMIEILLTTNKNIKAGEELRLDYGKDYWNCKKQSPHVVGRLALNFSHNHSIQV